MLSIVPHELFISSQLLAYGALVIVLLCAISIGLSAKRGIGFAQKCHVLSVFCLSMFGLAIVSLFFGRAAHVLAPVDLWLQLVQLNTLSSLMLALTSLIGWVITRFSDHYLQGEKQLEQYLNALTLTLLSIWLIVISNHVLVLVLLWLVNDLALHRLLTFYRQRQAAAVAAAKRLIFCMFANALMLGGALLLLQQGLSLHIDVLLQQLQGLPHLSLGTHIGLFALFAGMVLKSAPLPLHGWLLQVMEAPTPVSALLHAGIINLSGFLLLRLSSVLDHLPDVQLLLVASGTLTACIASLVMMTRISVKVMLAWSTCAQMGFMLLEIGLGAYSLALLHLIAHALYKAYTFLDAGQTSQQVSHLNNYQKRDSGAPVNQSPLQVQSQLKTELQTFAGSLIVLLVAGLLIWYLPISAASQVLGLCFAAGLVSVLTSQHSRHAKHQITMQTVILVAVVAIIGYGLLHFIFAEVVTSSTLTPPIIHLVLPLIGFGILLWLQQSVLLRTQGKLASWLHPHAFAGFYLDEYITRIISPIIRYSLYGLSVKQTSPKPNDPKQNTIQQKMECSHEYDC